MEDHKRTYGAKDDPYASAYQINYEKMAQIFDAEDYKKDG